jgi:hypothetical protein
MTLHLSHIGFTLGRTFIPARSLASLVPEDDPASGQVVRRQLDQDPIAWKYPDVVHPHLSRDMGEDPVAVIQLDFEHGVREGLDHLSLDLDALFLLRGFLLVLGHAVTFVSGSTDLACP